MLRLKIKPFHCRRKLYQILSVKNVRIYTLQFLVNLQAVTEVIDLKHNKYQVFNFFFYFPKKLLYFFYFAISFVRIKSIVKSKSRLYSKTALDTNNICLVIDLQPCFLCKKIYTEFYDVAMPC